MNSILMQPRWLFSDDSSCLYEHKKLHPILNSAKLGSKFVLINLKMLLHRRESRLFHG